MPIAMLWSAAAAAGPLTHGSFHFGPALPMASVAAPAGLGDGFLLQGAAQSGGVDAATAALFAGPGSAWAELHLDPDAGVAAAASGANGTGAASSASHAASGDMIVPAILGSHDWFA